MKIAGSRAVVTGGASGIGRAIATALATRDCRVLIADIDGYRARKVASEIGYGTIAAQCDVANHAAVQALADFADDAMGGVDLVFANAGVSVTSPVLDYGPEAFDWIFGVNVRGVWSTAAVFGRRIRDAGRPGYICLTGSEHSLGMQHAGIGFYTATKHAVLGMADVLRAELPPNLGLSVLCPGLVMTELNRSKRSGPLPQDDPSTLAMSDALMARGMNAAEIALMAIEGVERGDFLIVTHACAAPAAKRRYDEIAAAFAAQAPWTVDADRYDVNTVIASLMQANSSAKPPQSGAP